MSEVKNIEIRNVIIFPFSRSLPAGLRDALKAKGISSVTCPTESEVTKALAKSPDDILIVYCDKNVKLEEITAKLSTSTELHKSPMIIVGEGVDRYESFLNRYFVLATTITLPCEHSDIVAAVRYVTRYVEKLKKQKDPQKQAESSVSDLPSYQKLYRDFPTIPELAFSKLKELNLFEKEVGGEEYATVFRPQLNDDHSFLPLSSKYKKIISDATGKLPEDRLSRYMRIGKLSNLILVGLGFSGDTLENTRTASMFYSLGLFDSTKNLTQEQYLLGNADSLRKEICSHIKDSAINLSEKIQEEQVKRIITLTAKLIGAEESLDNTSECLAASAISTADAVDRVIYRRNVFQPVAAYSVLSILRKEEFSFIHPMVLGVLVKLLAEAVTSKISVLSKASRVYEFTSLLEAAKDIDEAIVEGNHKSVSLISLEPGMRISHGINTEDGKSLINESIELDQDLIWRLWQLSAIRPLQKNILINNDE